MLCGKYGSTLTNRLINGRINYIIHRICAVTEVIPFFLSLDILMSFTNSEIVFLLLNLISMEITLNFFYLLDDVVAPSLLWVRETLVSVEYSSILDVNAYFNITIFPRDGGT